MSFRVFLRRRNEVVSCLGYIIFMKTGNTGKFMVTNINIFKKSCEQSILIITCDYYIAINYYAIMITLLHRFLKVVGGSKKYFLIRDRLQSG